MKTTIIPSHANRKVFELTVVVMLTITMLIPIQKVHAQVNYYVGGTGASDSNPGTSSQPFATIQKAATVAVSGNIVNIREGTYRETVTPTNSGVTYQPDGGEIVVISGLNTADGGWTVHSGQIYKKTVTLPVTGYNVTISDNTTLAANQVFKDGVMMFEARWPKLNTPADLLDRDVVYRGRSSTSNWNATSLTDSGIPNIAGGWNGGKIFIVGWFIAHTTNITSHAGTTIGFNSPHTDLRFHQYYYLTGKLGALTTAKEWHYESNTLYFWQPGGGSPTGVEYKARNWGFDLRDKSNITIVGLQFVGCEPMTGDVNSLNIVLDGIKSKYQNHTVLQEGADVIYYNAKQTGIKLIGAGSTIKNSELQYAASQAIWLGEDCTAENNLITDVNYEANYGAGVSLWESTGGQVITQNTIARAGRSCIDFGGYVTLGQHLNMDISYNDVYDFGLLHADVGGMYGARMNNLTGTRIHHNWIHDNKAVVTPVTEYEVGVNAGIYFDQACGPSTVDHNVFWNNYQADYVIENANPQRNAGPTNVYNNTLATTNQPPHVWARSYLTFTTSPPNMDIQRNNIYRDDLFFNWDTSPSAGNVQNSLFNTQNPNFIGSGTDGLVYRLSASSSLAINQGIVISGITDGFEGSAPDLGAYEFGATDWVPGYVAPIGGTVATPAFDPGAGTYTAAQSVAMTTTTSGASIRYTTDGSTPTASSTLYTTPVNISGTTTLKAIAIKSGMTNSAVATAVYTINISGTTTVNNTVTGTGQNQFEYVGSGWGSGPNTGAYQDDEHYTATTNDYYEVDFTGTQIQVYSQKFTSQGIAAYSIDGGTETNVDHYSPTKVLNTLVYTSPTLANGSHTLKVRVTGTKHASSSSYWLVADRVAITAETHVAAPTFDPVAGTYTSPQSVTISTATSGASIRYTTDGSTPTASSTLYTGPVNISTSTTLKAIAIKSGMINSAVATAGYTLNISGTTTVNNTITGTGQNQFEYAGSGWGSGPSTGAYQDDEHYTVTTNDYYQVDFSGTQIEVYSQKFTSQGIAAYSIDGGTETNVDHYSPTKVLNTLVYTSPALANGSHTLKVRVTGTKHASSSSYWLVADRVVITAATQVASPTFDPVAGTYTSAQSVTISTATSGAEIRYTTDGSTPTASSTLYTGPVNISTSTTLKAIGIKSGLTNSAVATAGYTINIPVTTTINNTVTGTGQNQFEYVGSGWGSGPSTGAYQDDEHYTVTTNDYYQVDFSGTQIEVYSQKFTSQGIAAYSIDGGTETNVDHYSPTKVLNTLVYTSPLLTNGSHTLKVRVTGTKNASSSSYWLVADRVVITSDGGGGRLKSPTDGSQNPKGVDSGGDSTGISIVSWIHELENNGDGIIYPNPGKGHYSLNSQYDINAVQIYSVSEGKAYTLENPSQERIKEINMSTFSDGMYLLKMFNGKEYFFVKIVKGN